MSKYLLSGIVTTIAFLTLAITIGFFYPLAVIWSVNTLFGTKIAYTIWNWVAVVILHIFFQGHSFVKVKK